MSRSVFAATPASHSIPVDHGSGNRSTAVDQSLSALRKVVSDLSYTRDALEAAMGKDRSYIDKVLTGEKPMPSWFLDLMPADVAAEWHSRCAESFGRIVVSPVDAATADRYLAIALLSRHALPVKASQMAHAELPTNQQQRRA